MNSTEIAIYAVETKAIITILWGLLLIALISLIGVSITYVLLRIRLRTGRRRESQLARHVAAKSIEITRLEERVAELTTVESSVAALTRQVRHAQAIRARTEERLVEQNSELESLREQIAEQAGKLVHQRDLIEHSTLGRPRTSRKAA